MSSATQELELTVAEGLLGALDTPRGLDTARLLLKDDALDEAGIRAALEAMVAGGKLCGVCGADPCSCGVEEADAKADAPATNIGEDFNLPPEKKRRRRKRRKPKGAKMEEATVTGNGSVPGDPGTQDIQPWGGVPYSGDRGSTRIGSRGRDKDVAQPRVGRGLVDVALMKGDKFTEPPNLRDADGWARCGNCVFFNKGLCNLYGWDRPPADVVHRGGFNVDRDDLCDAHLSLSPNVTRLAESLDAEDERLAEAARAANSSMIVRSRARVARAEERLNEAISEQLEEMWSDASRAAALASRKAHGGGGRHLDKFGTELLDRDKGESALHYAVRRLRDKPPSATMHQDVRKALYGANHHALQHSDEPAPVAASRLLIREVSSSAYPGLDRSPKKNWVDKAGGLPRYIERIAKHLHYEKGKDIGQAIAIAVNAVKKMCASGDTNFPGKQNVNPKSHAEACAAVAQWEAKKAKGKAKRAVNEASAWDDFDVALGLWEAAHRPIPPSDAFLVKLHQELALAEGGGDWMLGLAALDEADFLLERYGNVLEENELVVSLDESGIVTLYHHLAGFHGKWDPIRHPRAPRGRKGGGEFSKKTEVLSQIENVAKRGAGLGQRDKQRGYRHPEGATSGERTVAEMFDKVDTRDMSIMPAERKMLGSYLRRRGNVDVAHKIESGRSRTLSKIEAEDVARIVRGQGPGTSSMRSLDKKMQTGGGRIGTRGFPPTNGSGRRNPSVGGADKSGAQGASASPSGRRNAPSGGVDAAITTVLGQFPGLDDWHVEKQGDDYHLHVKMGNDEHVIGVSPEGKVTYLSGPQKKKAPKAKVKPIPKEIVDYASAANASAKATKEKAYAAVDAHLGAAQDGELVPSGEWSKPYHMPAGAVYRDTQGEMHTHLQSGKGLMMGKKGPLAASKVLDHKTGGTKMVPAFVQKEYEMMLPKDELIFAPAKPPAQDDLEAMLAQSVGGGATSLAGKNVVITGSIPGMTRDEAYAKLAHLGVHRHNSVKSDSHVLITGESVGQTKKKAAAAKGLKVISYKDVSELLEAEEDGMDRRLEDVERQLREATSSAEIVRLRARRNVLLERDFSSDKRKKLSDKGKAMPDGSFPIENEEDLKNAKRLAGKAKDPAAARRHIAKRERALKGS